MNTVTAPGYAPAQSAGATAIKNRAPHELNDARVTLRAGARMACRADVYMDGGHGTVGIVWGVDIATGRAMVDFGAQGGSQLRGLALLTDLEVVS
jgi:hypothetical protein